MKVRNVGVKMARFIDLSRCEKLNLQFVQRCVLNGYRDGKGITPELLISSLSLDSE